MREFKIFMVIVSTCVMLATGGCMAEIYKKEVSAKCWTETKREECWK